MRKATIMRKRKSIVAAIAATMMLGSAAAASAQPFNSDDALDFDTTEVIVNGVLGDVTVDFVDPVPTELDTGEAGNYTVVTHNPSTSTRDLAEWYLGFDVSPFTGAWTTVNPPVDIEACPDNNFTGCVPIASTGAEVIYASGILYIVGAPEATALAPGASNTQYFTATFREAGTFVGNVYVFEGVSPANAAGVVYENDFSVDGGNWGPWPTSAAPPVHDAGAGLMVVNGSGMSSLAGLAAFNTFAWPAGGYDVELDIYIDGTEFDYTVAANRNTGPHMRDFIFHVGTVGSEIRVNASNNSNWNQPPPAPDNSGALAAAGNMVLTDGPGWYTFRHEFREDESTNSLAVTLSVIDADGDTVFTTVRNAPADLISGTGGPRYQWLTYTTGPVQIDNQRIIRN